MNVKKALQSAGEHVAGYLLFLGFKAVIGVIRMTTKKGSNIFND